MNLSTLVSKCKSVFLFVGSILCTTTIFAQDSSRFIGEKITTNYESQLASLFVKHDVFQINSADLVNYACANKKQMMLNLELGTAFNWEILLYENNLIDQNYFLTNSSDTGNSTQTSGTVKTFSGYLQGNKGGKVGLTIDEHFIFGMIHHDDQAYFIEPLNGILSDAPQDLFIVYNTQDAIQETEISCGVKDVVNHKKNINNQLPNATVRTSHCAELELALAADQSIFDKYGTVGDVETYIFGIWNLVAPDWVSWFSQDIEFKIVTTFVVTGNDPWTTDTDVEVLLPDFATWGNNGNFGATHDLGQLWTNRDIHFEDNDNVVGFAYVGVVCENSRYSIIEDFSTTANFVRQTVSHEVGHNFGSGHDADGGQDIMAPTVNGSFTWSTNSVDEITAHIDSRTCLVNCLKCVDITSIEVQNCGGGTYDLEICIEHIDRANQSSLEITADGIVSNFSFNSTGEQCEVISGLPANGTLTTAAITVRDTNDNSDECTKTATYNIPHPSCVCSTIISENFDALTLPPNWSNVASGTNSNGKWEFGTETPGLSGPGGSLNGSGMAFWDDDANGHPNNGSEYMELTTNGINLTNFEFVTVEFDYNFRTDNGVDRFLVDAWDGNSWSNLLNINANDCGQWGCDIPHFSMVVDNFINPDFKLRFTYDDSADSWQWYVAIDNLEICGYELAPLPINLHTFEVTENDCYVYLDWSIAAENTLDSYEIERSQDGISFFSIGEIKNNLEKHIFNFVDDTPNQENYYRLKSVDETGEINYSNLKYISTDCVNADFDILNVFPNPVNELLNFTIKSSRNTKQEVQIKNAYGATIQSQIFQNNIGKNSHSIELKNLAAGIYFLYVNDMNGNYKVIKFVKS